MYEFILMIQTFVIEMSAENGVKIGAHAYTSNSMKVRSYKHFHVTREKKSISSPPNQTAMARHTISRVFRMPSISRRLLRLYQIYKTLQTTLVNLIILTEEYDK